MKHIYKEKYRVIVMIKNKRIMPCRLAWVRDQLREAAVSMKSGLLKLDMEIDGNHVNQLRLELKWLGRECGLPWVILVEGRTVFAWRETLKSFLSRELHFGAGFTAVVELAYRRLGAGLD